VTKPSACIRKIMPKKSFNAKKKISIKEKFPCLRCGVFLSSPYNLKIHTDTNCSTEKRFVCEVSKLIVENLQQYFHFYCLQICSSKFLTQQSLKTHVNSLHFGEKSFACQYCGNKYLSKGQLKVHERSHTKEKS
jgi:KRAB domain-containing zinc finger protein